MPLTKKGSTIIEKMKQSYGSKKKAEQVFYASKNAGTITGVDMDKKSKIKKKVKSKAKKKMKMKY